MFRLSSKTTRSIALVKSPGLLAVLFVATLGLYACSKSEEEDHSVLETGPQDVAEEFEELTESVQDFAFDKKEDASEFLDQEIEQLDNKISEFEQDLNQERSELSQNIVQEKEEAINAIKGYRDDLQAMTEKIKNSSEDEWQAMQSNLAQTYNSTKQEIKETWNDITNS